MLSFDIKDMVLYPEDAKKIAVESDIARKLNAMPLRKGDSLNFDEHDIRRARDWAILANQVVGAELIE